MVLLTICKFNTTEVMKHLPFMLPPFVLLDFMYYSFSKFVTTVLAMTIFRTGSFASAMDDCCILTLYFLAMGFVFFVIFSTATCQMHLWSLVTFTLNEYPIIMPRAILCKCYHNWHRNCLCAW